jgi:ATP-dependent protease Clp ATPase subunit
LFGRKHSDDALRCSFCHKSQDVVGKLISSPSDYPRACICDECIAVCNSILEDDRAESPSTAPDSVYRQRRQLVHALVDEVSPEKLDTLIERIGEFLEERAN